MELFYETPDRRAKLYLGDSRHLPIEDESIDMIATSPPYWGKRDYGQEVVVVWGDGWEGQLGLEPTWQQYIAHLCECAKEWWRVLKPTGNLFINQGDTFAGSCDGRGGRQQPKWPSLPQAEGRAPQSVASIPKMKLGIPFRLRFALNDMGWVSRADVIWYKGKDYGDVEYIGRSGELIRGDGDITKMAMPESARREACSYEMVFRFAKTHKMNYYVHEKTGECMTSPPSKRVEGVDFEWIAHNACGGRGCDKAICHDGMKKRTFWHGYSEWFDLDAVRGRVNLDSVARYGRAKIKDGPWRIVKPSGSETVGANPGDVWIIQPEPFKEKHYACWPSKLCEMMIKVGCPKEVCPKCGKPRERITKPSPEYAKHLGKDWADYEQDQAEGRGHFQSGDFKSASLPTKRNAPALTADYQTIGWSDCGCGEGFVPGVVLDPFFGGSWRLARVALNLGRNVIGIEMKKEYLEMAKDISIYGEKGLSKEKARRKEGATQRVLL